MWVISSRYHPHIIQISSINHPHISSKYHPHIIQISPTYHPNIINKSPTHIIQISPTYHPDIINKSPTHIIQISPTYHPTQGFLVLQDCVYTIGKGWVGRKDVIFIKAHKIFHVSQGYLGAKWFMCLVRKS